MHGDPRDRGAEFVVGWAGGLIGQPADPLVSLLSSSCPQPPLAILPKDTQNTVGNTYNT
jgi:hypothetical protein